MENEFYYPSRDGKTQIHAMEWVPEGEIKGVLQICHGMVEYIKSLCKAKPIMDILMRQKATSM